MSRKKCFHFGNFCISVSVIVLMQINVEVSMTETMLGRYGESLLFDQAI